MKISKPWIIRMSLFIYIILVYFTADYYRFMIPNTLLAFIPIEIAFQSKRFATFSWKRQSLFYLVWLFFYPNGPYLFTDLFHIAKVSPYSEVIDILRSDAHLWYHFCLLVSGCLFFGFVALHTFNWMINQLFVTYKIENKWIKSGIYILLTILSSVAIYIGRFLRFHTVDIILSPVTILSEFVSLMDKSMLQFVLLITGFQLILLAIIALLQNNQLEGE